MSTLITVSFCPKRLSLAALGWISESGVVPPTCEQVELIITRAKLMACSRRFVFCKDSKGRRIHEGDVIACWTNGDLIKGKGFPGAHFAMFFVCYSERAKHFAGISTEVSWICTPIDRFWGKCSIAGNVFDKNIDYRSYLSRFVC